MARYMVTVRHIDCFTVEVEADDCDAAAEAAEQQIELNPREADWAEVDVEPELMTTDDGPSPTMRVIAYDETGPHDLGNVEVSRLHDMISKAVGED